MSVFNLLPQLGGTYTPTEPPKRKIPAKGYSADRKPKHKTVLTEAQVLEARWLNQYACWTIERVATHYQLHMTYTRALLDYSVRGKLHPSKDLYPAGYEPERKNHESQVK